MHHNSTLKALLTLRSGAISFHFDLSRKVWGERVGGSGMSGWGLPLFVSHLSHFKTSTISHSKQKFNSSSFRGWGLPFFVAHLPPFKTWNILHPSIQSNFSKSIWGAVAFRIRARIPGIAKKGGRVFALFYVKSTSVPKVEEGGRGQILLCQDFERACSPLYVPKCDVRLGISSFCLALAAF